MKQKKLQVAICYDFDGTLAAGNMQEYGFMDRLSVKPDAFWAKSAVLVKQHSADKILCYMKCMLVMQDIHLTKQIKMFNQMNY